MDLSQATSKKLIFLNQTFTTKDEIFEFVAQKFVEAAVVTSAADFKQALYERENEGLTGFENGLAIPHGKSSTVKTAQFAVVRLTKPLTASEYVSLNPENQVDTLFILAIPEAEAGSTHLDILAELARRLGDPNYVKQIKVAVTTTDIFNLLAKDEKKCQPK